MPLAPKSAQHSDSFWCPLRVAHGGLLWAVKDRLTVAVVARAPLARNTHNLQNLDTQKRFVIRGGVRHNTRMTGQRVGVYVGLVVVSALVVMLALRYFGVGSAGLVGDERGSEMSFGCSILGEVAFSYIVPAGWSITEGASVEQGQRAECALRVASTEGVELPGAPGVVVLRQRYESGVPLPTTAVQNPQGVFYTIASTEGSAGARNLMLYVDDTMYWVQLLGMPGDSGFPVDAFLEHIAETFVVND